MAGVGGGVANSKPQLVKSAKLVSFHPQLNRVMKKR